MTKFLLTFSALQTFLFGIGAVLMPGILFRNVGVSLDPAGELIARGYGATLLGLGIVLWGLRGAPAGVALRWSLAGLAAFNAIETAVQLHAGLGGIVDPIIFGNVGLHALRAFARVIEFLRCTGEGQAG